MHLFRTPLSGIGVDLGTSTVKVVQLAKTGRDISLVTYAVAGNPNPLIALPSADAVEVETVLLREMFRRAGVGRAPVVAALPILSVFSTVLELPEMSARDMDAAVAFAARRYVPSPLSDVVLGWTLIGSPRETRSPASGTSVSASDSGGSVTSAAGGIDLDTGEAAGPAPSDAGEPARSGFAAGDAGGPAKSSAPAGNGGTAAPHAAKRRIQEVFLTAAPRDLVGRYTAFFDRLGIGLHALEVESNPLARSLLAGEARPVLLVDLGDRATSFAVVDGGYLRLNQAMDVGGITLTHAIAEKLSISPEEAEKRKRTEGMSRGDVATPLAAAMRPVLGELIQRGEVLRRLYERKKTRTLGRVILIGGGARLPGLTSFWTGITGLPAEVGNPWRGVSVPAALANRLQALGPSFAVAVGLALRPFEGG